ncbi:unnamed protein product [Caenorhabditis angaria]|uniref:Uncharacterized protein n=1 Tax=Caenorhabditis angaria TaxID=860376 RepID=A0A9P1IKA7_9PELO|nr:unnamed protein product [Caenorhabditis angaria]
MNSLEDAGFELVGQDQNEANSLHLDLSPLGIPGGPSFEALVPDNVEVKSENSSSVSNLENLRLEETEKVLKNSIVYVEELKKRIEIQNLRIEEMKMEIEEVEKSKAEEIRKLLEDQRKEFEKRREDFEAAKLREIQKLLEDQKKMLGNSQNQREDFEKQMQELERSKSEEIQKLLQNQKEDLEKQMEGFEVSKKIIKLELEKQLEDQKEDYEKRLHKFAILKADEMRRVLEDKKKELEKAQKLLKNQNEAFEKQIQEFEVSKNLEKMNIEKQIQNLEKLLENERESFEKQMQEFEILKNEETQELLEDQRKQFEISKTSQNVHVEKLLKSSQDAKSEFNAKLRESEEIVQNLKSQLDATNRCAQIWKRNSDKYDELSQENVILREKLDYEIAKSINLTNSVSKLQNKLENLRLESRNQQQILHVLHEDQKEGTRQIAEIQQNVHEIVDNLNFV